jgi:hypothetical protein
LINDHTEADILNPGELRLHLDRDLNSVDFERFLSILYPPCVTKFLQWSKIANLMFSEFGKYALTTLDEWTSVLRLAFKWGFESIRSLALRELLPLASPVDKIVIGRDYGLEDWLTPAFVDVCARAEPLSLEEAEKMSNADVTRIFQAREHARSSSAPVATMAAEGAVACIFSNNEVTSTTPADYIDGTANPPPVAVEFKPHTKSSTAEKTSSETMPEELLVDGAEVDDDLMEALAIWSRLCSSYYNSNYDIDPYSSRNYGNTTYQAAYESFLTYFEGPQLRVTSLRQFLSAMLQTDLECNQSAIYSKLFTDLCDRVQAGGQCVLGKAEIRQMLNEQCAEFVTYECALDGASSVNPRATFGTS